MHKVSEYLRDNIRRLVEQRGGLTKLSKALGHNNPSFLTQMVGPNPTREVSERTARRVEEATGLEPGVLDRAPAGAPLIAEVIEMVGRAYEAEGVPLAPAKFSDLVAPTLADSMARGSSPSEDHVRAVVRLLR